MPECPVRGQDAAQSGDLTVGAFQFDSDSSRLSKMLKSLLGLALSKVNITDTF